MTEQITYLEKLLEGYKERFKRGERELEAKIRATAAHLEELKLKKSYEEEKPKRFSITSVLDFRRGCCGGR